MNKRILVIILSLIMLLLIVKIYNYNRYYFISYGNYVDSAYVIKEKTNTHKILSKYKTYDYLKIDLLVNEKIVTYDELCQIIKQADNNGFNYGITLNDSKIHILKEELLIHQIIDYKYDRINFDNLNKYLISKGYYYEINNIDNVTIFETKSFFYDKEKKKLEIPDNYTNIDYITQNGINRLLSMLKENGQFVYGYNVFTGDELGSYNILRHAGTVWSMIKYYERNPSVTLKNSIDDGMEYLMQSIIFDDNDIAYVVEKKSSEIKLGGNGLALIALSEYLSIFENERYYSIAKRIANGIISMQQNDGSFIHVLNLDGSLKEQKRTVFYDGEATFALLKFYKISDDKTYFNYSKKAIDYFLQENYNQYRDHWISYAIFEYLQYDTNDQYILFALNNYTRNKELFRYDSFGPTRLELLTTVYKTYTYLQDKVPNNKYIMTFELDSLKETINKEFNTLLSYYLSESMSIYYKNSNNIIGGFYSLKDNYRMRIDDIQHSLLGIMNYQDINENIK